MRTALSLPLSGPQLGLWLLKLHSPSFSGQLSEGERAWSDTRSSQLLVRGSVIDDCVNDILASCPDVALGSLLGCHSDILASCLAFDVLAHDLFGLCVE